MNQYEITVERPTVYTPELAQAIGRLMPFLSESQNDDPISQERLQEIIESPDREQFVALLEGKVIGSAVLNKIVGNIRDKAWLEDFVVDPEFQGQGVGAKIWLEMLDWCRERNIKTLDFTSGQERESAHRFYIQQGAVERSSSVYRVEIN